MSPLVDPAPLHILFSQLGGDRAVCNRFVNDFIALWQARTQRLRAALATADVDEADVVLLSICASSNMLGAVRLERTAFAVHSALKNNDLSGCALQLPGLSEVGNDTCLALSQHIARG
ncbi:hypothetical protein [Cryobacterium sp. Y11]|uniref:hypothetical protein n=1 Tax=Cryobacterium sp. Y11 TaxID=2045016 RepID=UPI000CE2DFBF|nr:hypothetical protein [Cryobacterium sp. Y11]